MKVIGRTKYGYIVDISTHELACFNGKTGGDYADYSPHKRFGSLDIGDEVDIDKIFQDASKIVATYEKARVGLGRLQESAGILLDFLKIADAGKEEGK